MFKGKVVLVTGGATGLGRATSLAFARQGANIAVVDLNEPAAQETAAEIRALNRSCCVIRANVSEPGVPEQMVRQTVESLERLDVLVNNAATWAVEPFLEITEEEWVKVFDVNVKGLMFCLLAAARAMRQTGEAKLSISPHRHLTWLSQTTRLTQRAKLPWTASHAPLR